MDAEKIIAGLFGRHVRGLAQFDPSHVYVQRGTSGISVWGCYTENPYLLLTYEHEGVSILYHDRVTEYRGDVDRFVKQKVTIDGTLIYADGV